MKMAWLYCSLAVAGLTAAGFLASHLTAPGAAHPKRLTAEGNVAEAPGSERTVDNTELRGRIALLEKQIASLSATPAPATSGGTRAAEPPELRDTARHPTPEELEADDRRWHAHMTEVHAKFVAEPRQSGWARTTANMIQDALSSDQVLGPVARNVECHSTTCRVELLDNRSPEFSKRLPNFLTRVGQVLPTAEADFVTNPDGTRTASIYLSSTVADPGAGAS
jgi:hypothetical protein